MLTTSKGKCFICGKEGYTERHHIFGGPNRKNSERDGLVVNLCNNHHTGREGVHTSNGKNYMDWLHREGQKEYEAMKISEGMTADEARADFIKKYIRSYL